MRPSFSRPDKAPDLLLQKIQHLRLLGLCTELLRMACSKGIEELPPFRLVGCLGQKMPGPVIGCWQIRTTRSASFRRGREIVEVHST